MTKIISKTQNNGKCVFKISYDTDGTADHTIDAHTLGTSIINMSKLIKEADEHINSKAPDLRVEVKANSEGSFVVEFVTYLQNAGVNPLSVLGLIPVTAGVATVFGAIKQIKSRKVKLIEKTSTGISKVFLDDETSIELPSHIADLVVNKSFRDSIDKVISRPLSESTNAKFIIKDELDNEVLTITQRESIDFNSITSNVVDQIIDTEEQKTIRFTNINFDGNAGWKAELADRTTVPIIMQDNAFINKISKNNLQFAKADLYSVKLRTVKKIRHGTTPTYKRYVIQVTRNVTQSQPQT
ncbi:hypothetical protein [Psychromonas sp. SR45-3]|uniref:hypothetical protein n=1 Tax=Psychromonas sp. SR45-3 TaxID=2760930 RepID=UPI0015FE5B54|nr:hypothetical protein [Psychromonas sp. SR45-3]MBB1272501.1 hypothetical protein [Psychromonas sp. SR45-3]